MSKILHELDRPDYILYLTKIIFFCSIPSNVVTIVNTKKSKGIHMSRKREKKERETEREKKRERETGS